MFSEVNQPRRTWLRAALSLLVATPALARPADAPPLLLAGRYHAGTGLHGWWVSEKYDGVRGFWDGSALRTRGG